MSQFPRCLNTLHRHKKDIMFLLHDSVECQRNRIGPKQSNHSYSHDVVSTMLQLSKQILTKLVPLVSNANNN